MKDEAKIRVERLNAYCLKKGWVSKKAPTRGSASELHRRLGKSQSFWSDLLRGEKSFSADLAREIERGLDLPRYFLEEEGELPEFVPVTRVSVKVSAGAGAVPEVIEVEGSLQFRRDFLAACGASKDSARIVDVKGTSMEPTIVDGAVLLINTANREPRNNTIFALVVGESLLVKRLLKQGESWIARSDNRDQNPDIVLDDSQHHSIIGRAVWMGTKL
jgi:phage repressor protein C with HTH and peptisase S24 domain